MRRQPNRRGLTLVEVLVAMGLLALATLALVSANTFAARSSSRSYRRYVAMRLAQQRLDALTLGGDKPLLPTDVDKRYKDTSLLDCQRNGLPTDLCTTDDLMGWVDIYGRPCRKTGTPAQGYHPTCQYRRYILYKKEVSLDDTSDVWRIFLTVSHSVDGNCIDYLKGDNQCIVTSSVLTR